MLHLDLAAESVLVSFSIQPIARNLFLITHLPGRYLADNSVWIAMASILSAFSIEKALDADGNEIVPIPEYTKGTVA